MKSKNEEQENTALKSTVEALQKQNQVLLFERETNAERQKIRTASLGIMLGSLAFFVVFLSTATGFLEFNFEPDVLESGAYQIVEDGELTLTCDEEVAKKVLEIAEKESFLLSTFVRLIDVDRAPPYFSNLYQVAFYKTREETARQHLYHIRCDEGVYGDSVRLFAEEIIVTN